jgi:hypothetical protein
MGLYQVVMALRYQGEVSIIKGIDIQALDEMLQGVYFGVAAGAPIIILTES